MTLPRRLAKPAKRSNRWRSQAHCSFVRSHACCACGADAAIEVAHLRLGTGAGMGQKPHDWHTISLCRDCHAQQHRIGEAAFAAFHKIDLNALASEFASASPKAIDIRREKMERGCG